MCVLFITAMTYQASRLSFPDDIQQISASLLFIGASLSEPQHSQEWYMRQVHKNLLNKKGLLHTVAESCTHIPFAKVY